MFNAICFTFSLLQIMLIFGPHGHCTIDPGEFHLYMAKSAYHKDASFRIQLEELLLSVQKHMTPFILQNIINNSNIKHLEHEYATRESPNNCAV